NNATYHFKSDTLIIEATDRTSFFVQSDQTASIKRYDYKSLDKFYKLADISIENKELEDAILNLIPDNEIYFHLSGGWGVNPKNKDCSGNKMEIFLYNNENYYMQDLMWIYHENFGELQDRFNYNCAFIRNENKINKYLDMKDLLGEKYIFSIEGNNLTFRSPDNRNFLYLKSNY